MYPTNLNKYIYFSSKKIKNVTTTSPFYSNLYIYLMILNLEFKI